MRSQEEYKFSSVNESDLYFFHGNSRRDIRRALFSLEHRLLRVEEKKKTKKKKKKGKMFLVLSVEQMFRVTGLKKWRGKGSQVTKALP